MEDFCTVYFFHSTLHVCKKLFTSHTVKCDLCQNILNYIAQCVFHLLIQQTPFTLLLSIAITKLT